MDFGLAGIWYLELGIEDAIKHQAEMGWLNIDVGPELMRRVNARSFRELCESLGVKVWQLHLSFWDGEIELEKKHIKDIERWMKFCSIVNVPYMGFHPSKKEYTSPKEKEEIMHHNVDFFKKVGNLAEDTGVKIVIENMPNAQKTGAQITELLEIIDAVGSPSIGICLDTSHANAMNIDVVEAIHKCDTLLWATHIGDSNGTQGQHRIPFNADFYYYSKHKIDWFKVVHALKAINYQNPFMLELPGEDVEYTFVKDLKLEYARKLSVWLLNQ